MNDHSMRCPADLVTFTTLPDGRQHPLSVRCNGEIPVPVTPGFIISSALCSACGARFETGRTKQGHVHFSPLGPETVR